MVVYVVSVKKRMHKNNTISTYIPYIPTVCYVEYVQYSSIFYEYVMIRVLLWWLYNAHAEKKNSYSWGNICGIADHGWKYERMNC